jgi:hypothetical protein
MTQHHVTEMPSTVWTEPNTETYATPPQSALPASSPLAALLDRFTESLANPETATVGDFAGSVQALHSEFALLARHFRHDGPSEVELIDFDVIFPEHGETASAATLDPAYHGVAAEAELEHLCQTLSRG